MALAVALALGLAVALAVAVGLAVALALAVGLADMPPPYFWAEAAEANSNSSTALAANTTKIFFINHLPYLKQMPSLSLWATTYLSFSDIVGTS
jgi:amphi-Trp domain-containing protein